MKKYLKLTSTEAIRHFILRDNTLVPEASAEIAHKLNDLDKLKSELSVTIVLPTHYTKPDYEMDVIQLKNLITETENELLNILDKRKAAVYIENIKEAQQTIDYSLNIDSMVLYANEHFASVVKLPVSLEPEIMIGDNFDLRPLYKTRQQNRRYYILTVSRNVIRLIEAFNDKVIAEVTNEDFPFVNHDYHVEEAAELAQDSFIDNQIKEYFNDADKRFQKYYNENPLPLILAGDIKMTSYYEEQMDKEYTILAKVPGSFDKMPYHEIIKIVHPEVEKYREAKQKQYLSNIDTASSAYLLSTDIYEIFRSAVDGSAGTLYVAESFSLNGTIEEETQDGITTHRLTVAEKEPGDINRNDLLSELMKIVRDNGGDIIFVEDERMQPYNGVALARRF